MGRKRDQENENEEENRENENSTGSSNQSISPALPVPPRKIVPQKCKDQNSQPRSNKKPSRSRTRSRSPVHGVRESSPQPSSSRSIWSNGSRPEGDRSAEREQSPRSPTPPYRLISRSPSPPRSPTPPPVDRHISRTSQSHPHNSQNVIPNNNRNITEKRQDGRDESRNNNGQRRSVGLGQQSSGSFWSNCSRRERARSAERARSPRSLTPPHRIISRSQSPPRSPTPPRIYRRISQRSQSPPHNSRNVTPNNNKNITEKRQDGRDESRNNNGQRRSVDSSQQPSGSSCGKTGTGKKKGEYNFPMSEAKFQERVLYLLHDLRREIEELKRWKEMDLQADGAIELTRSSNLDEFMVIESSLKNLHTRQQMIKKLAVIGGLNYKDGAKNMMQRIMTNELMASMNVKGNRGKIAFGPTAVCKVVTASLVQHFKVTEHESIEAIAKVLKYAPDRRGGGGRKNNDNDLE